MTDLFEPYTSSLIAGGAVHKVRREYRPVAGEDEHPTTEWIHTPDLELIASGYWKVDGSSIVAMTQQEQDDYDAELANRVGRSVFAVAFSTSSSPYLTVRRKQARVLARFSFPGTQSAPAVKARVVAWLNSDGDSMTVRLRDSSDGSVIAERSTGITATEPTEYDLGALGNMSATPSIWELEAKRDDVRGAIASLALYGG